MSTNKDYLTLANERFENSKKEKLLKEKLKTTEIDLKREKLEFDKKKSKSTAINSIIWWFVLIFIATIIPLLLISLI